RLRGPERGAGTGRALDPTPRPGGPREPDAAPLRRRAPLPLGPLAERRPAAGLRPRLSAAAVRGPGGGGGRRDARPVPRFLGAGAESRQGGGRWRLRRAGGGARPRASGPAAGGAEG